jgi:hypothetical protein
MNGFPPHDTIICCPPVHWALKDETPGSPYPTLRRGQSDATLPSKAVDCVFDVPLRRKFQVAQPAILERLNKTFNKDRSFDPRAKPFGNNIRNLASLPVGESPC